MLIIMIVVDILYISLALPVVFSEADVADLCSGEMFATPLILWRTSSDSYNLKMKNNNEESLRKAFPM